MSLEVLNSPILSTIQDKGRFSYSNIGLCNSGVMDEYAYFIANIMLKNELNTNIIEISFSNVEFKIQEDTTICVTGAKCDFFIDGEKKDIWQTHNVRKGTILKIGKILGGLRVYLAVKNGFKIRKEFGSYSTTLKEKIGGINGDKLKKKDVLPYEKYFQNYNVRLKKEYIPSYPEILTLRVILSYQDDLFSEKEKNTFFTSIYEVSNDSNRMGVKLKGNKISCEIDGIISEGIAYGSIQIPSDGQPIILLKDRQTIGGYPKIGTVLSIDCFKLAQAKPNSKIKFVPLDLCEAQKKVKKFYSSLCAI